MDLDDYVTLENASEYTVELAPESDEIAEIEGHVITATGEGDLVLTLTAGTASEECSLKVYSFLRSFYYYSFKDVGKHYTVYGYDYTENEETGEEEDYLSTIIYHSDNYVYQENYDEDGAMEGNQGLLMFDGAYSYEFELSENATTGEPEATLVEKYPVSVLNNWNPEFDAQYYFSYAEVEWSAQYGESLVLSGNPAIYFAQEVLFTGTLQDNSGNKYNASKIELGAANISDDENEPEYVFYGSCYISPSGSDEVYWFLDFEFDLENYGLEFLEEYCVPENAPVETDYYADYFEGHVISDYFLSPASTSVFGSSGYVQFSAAVYDSEGQVVAQPANSFMNQYYKANLPVLSGQMFYGENSMWNVDPSTKEFVNGYINTENGVFFAVAVDDEENPTYVEPVSDLQSAWNSDLGFPGLFVEDNWENSIDTVAVDDEENPTMHQFAFNDGKYNTLFACLMNGIGGGEILTYLDFIDELFGGLDLLEYFTSSLIIAPSMGIAQFNFSLNSSVFGQYSVSGYTYKISVQFAADPSVASSVNAFETAVAPYCVAA